MKPSRLQYMFAYSFEIAAVAGVLGAWAFGLSLGVDGLAPVMDVSYFGGVALLVVLAAPGGAVLGLIFLLPFLRMASRKLNGAPYKPGDGIQILRGPHRGTVTTVYDVWDSRDEVRVELGAEHKKAVTDVFTLQEICREKAD